MKKVAIISLLIGLCGIAAAEQAPPGSMPSDQVREAEIRKVYASWVEAWNRHDVAGMSAIEGRSPQLTRNVVLVRLESIFGRCVAGAELTSLTTSAMRSAMRRCSSTEAALVRVR